MSILILIPFCRQSCIVFFLSSIFFSIGSLSGSEMDDAPPTAAVPIRVGVLSSAPEPGKNTSQGLYLRILRDAGMEANAVSATEVLNGALNNLDLFIIGGGSGTAFNRSLGKDGGEMVNQFVRNGGGVMGSCAGGYSFVQGHNEALRYIEIANAKCIDFENGKWARGKGTVVMQPENSTSPVRSIFYANGPLWQITEDNRFGKTVALASFATEVDSKGVSKNIMKGTPAILAGNFGKGRFVLFSGHPEFYKNLGNNDLVIKGAQWVCRGQLGQDEVIDWDHVFPDSTAP